MQSESSSPCNYLIMKLKHTLQASLQDVFPYLADSDLFALVHPVISKMEHKGNGEYLVYETLKLGPVPFSFTYPAVIHYDLEKGTVHMQATVFKMTNMNMSFQLSEENGLTTVEENIDIQSKLPFNALTLKVLKSLHHKLFKNIARTLAFPS